jgi:hypothetical protein
MTVRNALVSISAISRRLVVSEMFSKTFARKRYGTGSPFFHPSTPDSGSCLRSLPAASTALSPMPSLPAVSLALPFFFLAAVFLVAAAITLATPSSLLLVDFLVFLLLGLDLVLLVVVVLFLLRHVVVVLLIRDGLGLGHGFERRGLGHGFGLGARARGPPPPRRAWSPSRRAPLSSPPWVPRPSPRRRCRPFS